MGFTNLCPSDVPVSLAQLVRTMHNLCPRDVC